MPASTYSNEDVGDKFCPDRFSDEAMSQSKDGELMGEQVAKPYLLFKVGKVAMCQ